MDLLEKRRRRDGLKLINLLEGEGFTTRFAGGAVRDRLLGKAPKDFDLATQATPEEVCRIFEQKNLKCIPTGIEHGTITVVTNSGPIEVTTLRRDVATDGRRATVAFSKDFAEDAARRDFTINAMYEDALGEIHDYYQGQEDIRNGVIRFVGDAGERIQEDYLRILRMYRFWSQLGFAPTEEARAACRDLCAGIKQLSRERVTSEVLLLLGGKHSVVALKTAASDGVLGEIFGFPVSDAGIEALKALSETENDPLAGLIVLLIHSGLEHHSNLAKDLVLDNQSLAVLKAACDNLNSECNQDKDNATIMGYLDQFDIGPNNWLNFFAKVFLAAPNADHAELNMLSQFEEQNQHIRLAQLPISGNEIMQLGVPSGPRVGEILTALKTAFRNGEWSSKKEGLALAKTLAK